MKRIFLLFHHGAVLQERQPTDQSANLISDQSATRVPVSYVLLCLTSLRSLRVSCFTCSRTLLALVPHVIQYVPLCLMCLVPYGIRALSALMPYIPGTLRVLVLFYLPWLVSYVISCRSCLVLYVLLCS